MSLFFERHFQRRKYFFDEVLPLANIWSTEFHLSSYQLLDEEQDRKDTDLQFFGGHRVIRRRCTSFRFLGDFFDRFWTCHVLETEPREEKDDDSKVVEHFEQLTKLKGRLPVLERNKRPWHQRKVLELLVFDRMLEKIIQSYNEMLTEIGSHLGSQFPHAKSPGADGADLVLVSSALFSTPLDNDTYLRLSKQWPIFLHTLQVIEEDLKEILEKIDLWNNREKDRQLERPRWTRNDESRYRAAITKLTSSNNQKVRDLDHYLAQIQFLAPWLSSRLESSRNELSFQSAENVRFFTAVTVIFLPLGFATGTFSMSGTPNRSTLWQMIVMAVVVFALTVVTLVNVRVLDKTLFRRVAAGVNIVRTWERLRRTLGGIGKGRIQKRTKSSDATLEEGKPSDVQEHGVSASSSLTPVP